MPSATASSGSGRRPTAGGHRPVVSLRLPLRVSSVPAARARRAASRGRPARFWIYAALIGLYGIRESRRG
jgi:hypothetical protein